MNTYHAVLTIADNEMRLRVVRDKDLAAVAAGRAEGGEFDAVAADVLLWNTGFALPPTEKWTTRDDVLWAALVHQVPESLR